MDNPLKKLVNAIKFEPISYEQGQDLLNLALKYLEKTKVELDQRNLSLEERQKAVSEVYSEIKGIFSSVENNKDFMLSDEYKKQIADLVKVPVIEKVIEKTETIIEKPIITNEIIKEINQEIEAEDIVDKINNLSLDDENKIDASHIKNLPKVNKFGGVIGIKEIIAGDNITVDNSNLGYPVISSTGGGGGVVTKTFAEITTLKGSAGLTVGQQYLISDYKTKHNVYDGTSVTSTIVEGSTEPLIVTAISTSEVSIEAKSTLYPEDVILYDSTNVLCEDGTTARNGFITFRKNSKGNETPYDFRNVKFLRWKLDATTWSAGTISTRGTLRKVGTKIYKYFSRYSVGTTEDPSTSLGWIEFLDNTTFTYQLAEKITGTTLTQTLGGAIATGTTQTDSALFYTFSNTSGEERSDTDYENVVIKGTGSTDLVTPFDSILTNNVFVDGARNVELINSALNTFVGNVIQSKFFSYSANLHKGDCLGMDISNGYHNVLGAVSNSLVDGPFKGNIYNIMSLSHHFSENLWNNIKNCGNCTTGPDFWENGVSSMTYSVFNSGFSFNEAVTWTNVVYLNCVYYSTFGDITRCVFLNKFQEAIFPDMQNAIIDDVMEYVSDMTPFESDLNSADFKKITTNNSDMFFTTIDSDGHENRRKFDFGTGTLVGVGNFVVGPASSTDNAIPRFNGTTGKLAQDSGITIDDDNYIHTGNGRIYGYLDNTYIDLYNSSTGGIDIHNLNGTAPTHIYGALIVDGTISTSSSIPMANGTSITSGPGGNAGITLYDNSTGNIHIKATTTAASLSRIRFYTGTTSTERMRLDENGNLGIGTTSPTALLDVNSSIIRLRTSKTPSSASDTGNAGDICWDANYIYICTATNTWKRTAIATW